MQSKREAIGVLRIAVRPYSVNRLDASRETRHKACVGFISVAVMLLCNHSVLNCGCLAPTIVCGGGRLLAERLDSDCCELFVDVTILELSFFGGLASSKY